MSGKYALVIGNTQYADPALAQLTAPGKDAEDLGRVLKDTALCAFDDVRVMLNVASYAVSEAIDAFFDSRKPDDLLLLYFSGHGVKDELGSLYLAVSNTNRARLRSTAIKSSFIQEAMEHCRARRQVLILDCCNSGAFPDGTKAATGGSVGVANAFGGTGRIILTASDATQFAWEGDRVIGETSNSLFTHFLVKGLEGEAENDGDGVITVDELYDYAYEQVRHATPNQTPSKFSSKQEGEIVLRQITQLDQIKAAPLPEALAESLDNPLAAIRLAAVQELARLLRGRNLALARSAREALEKLSAADDSYSVRKAAADALAPILAAEQAEAERLAAQKAEEQRIAAEKAEAQRLAAQKAEEDRLAAEKVEAERLAAEKAEQERVAALKAEAERMAAQKAEQQRLAAEKAAQEEAERQRLVELKAQQDQAERVAAEQAEAERRAAQKAAEIEAERKRLAEVKAQEEQAARLRAENAEAERARLKRDEEERQQAIQRRFDELERQISGMRAESEPELNLSPLAGAVPAVATTGMAAALPLAGNQRPVAPEIPAAAEPRTALRWRAAVWIALAFGISALIGSLIPYVPVLGSTLIGSMYGLAIGGSLYVAGVVRQRRSIPWIVLAWAVACVVDSVVERVLLIAVGYPPLISPAAIGVMASFIGGALQGLGLALVLRREGLLPSRNAMLWVLLAWAAAQVLYFMFGYLFEPLGHVMNLFLSASVQGALGGLATIWLLRREAGMTAVLPRAEAQRVPAAASAERRALAAEPPSWRLLAWIVAGFAIAAIIAFAGDPLSGSNISGLIAIPALGLLAGLGLGLALLLEHRISKWSSVGKIAAGWLVAWGLEALLLALGSSSSSGAGLVLGFLGIVLGSGMWAIGGYVIGRVLRSEQGPDAQISPTRLAVSWGLGGVAFVLALLVLLAADPSGNPFNATGVAISASIGAAVGGYLMFRQMRKAGRP